MNDACTAQTHGDALQLLSAYRNTAAAKHACCQSLPTDIRSGLCEQLMLGFGHHGAQLLHARRIQHPVYEPVLQRRLGVKVLVAVEVVLYLHMRLGSVLWLAGKVACQRHCSMCS